MRFLLIVQIIVSYFILPSVTVKAKTTEKIELQALGTEFLILFGQKVTDRQLAEMKEGIKKILDDVDQKMSAYRKDSLLAKINNEASKRPVRLDDDTFYVLEEAIRIAELSDGAFDPTFASFGDYWKLGPDFKVPSEALIKKRLVHVGYKKILLDRKTRSIKILDPETKLGLGGIAKGYSLDKIRSYILAKGIKNFVVYGGGDVAISGMKFDRPWRVGVQDPRDRKRFFAVLEMTSEFIVTSGDYERFKVVNNKLYHHIIDPHTGFPALKCRSVTVIAKSGTFADGLSTAIFVLGPQKGMKLVQSLKDVEALIVDNHNRIFLSSGLKDKIKITLPTDRPFPVSQ